MHKNHLERQIKEQNRRLNNLERRPIQRRNPPRSQTRELVGDLVGLAIVGGVLNSLKK